MVIGNLPVSTAAAVAAKGASFYFPVPLAETAGEFELQQYQVQSMGKSNTGQVFAGAAKERVYVLLASGQSLPNVLPIFVQEQLPKHVYIAQSQAKDSQKSAALISEIAKRFDLPVTIFPGEMPSAPLQTIIDYARQCFALVYEDYPQAQICLNGTGGTKMMSSAFARALGPTGEVVYCDTENDQVEYLAPEGRAPKILPADLTDLDSYLLIQGQKIVDNKGHDTAWQERAQARQALTRFLVDAIESKEGNNTSSGIFGYLNTVGNAALPQFRKDAKKAFTPVQEVFVAKGANAGLGLLWKEIDALMQDHAIYRDQGKTVEFLSEEAAAYACGGWLEEYAYLVMLDLGVPSSHWGIGVKILPYNMDLGNAPEKSFNEMDLAVVWRNRLLIIECKAGKIEGAKGQEYLNKLDTVKRHAGGLFSQAWLAHSQPISSESTAIKRASEYKIRLCGPQDVKQLGKHIQAWLAGQR